MINIRACNSNNLISSLDKFAMNDPYDDGNDIIPEVIEYGKLTIHKKQAIRFLKQKGVHTDAPNFNQLIKNE